MNRKLTAVLAIACAAIALFFPLIYVFQAVGPDWAYFDSPSMVVRSDVLSYGRFPLHEPSGVNPDAPVVTEEEQKLLAADAGVKRKMRETQERWLGFYGFELKGGEVVRGKDFGEKSRRWNQHLNHNHLRITRIIRSLRLFGLKDEARAVHDAFAGFARSRESEINRTTQAYWDVALNGELFAPIRGR